MKLIAILSILFLVSFYLSSLVFHRKNRFYLGGIEFLLLGYFMGPRVSGLVSRSMQIQLHPLLYFFMGWIGLFYGMQFRWTRLKREPFSMYLFAFAHSLFLLGAFFIVGFAFLSLLYDPRPLDVWIFASTLSVSSVTAIAYYLKNHSLPREDLRWLRFISAFDDLLPLLCIGFLLSYPLYSQGSYFWMRRISLVLSVPLLLGYLFSFLIRLAEDRNEIFLYTLGIILFCAGISYRMNLSPLLTGFLMGLFFTQANRRAELIFTVFHRVENSFYLFFLMLAGVGFVPAASGLILPLLAVVGIHALVKITSVSVLSTVLHGKNSPSSRLGWGLLAQGPMAIAFLVNYREFVLTASSRHIFTLLFLGMILNELVAARGFKRLGERT